MKRIARWYGISSIAVLALFSLIYSQRVTSVMHLTVFALVATGMVVLGLVIVPLSGLRTGLGRGGRWVVASFVLLWVWAAIRTFGHEFSVLVQQGGVPERLMVLPSWVAWVPVLTTLLALMFACLTVAALPDEDLASWLWWLAVAAVVLGLIGQGRALLSGSDSLRLSTGLGGAATLPVVFVMVGAALAGFAVVGYRRWWSAGFAAVAALELLLTGSRAGLLMLVVLAVVATAVWLGRGGRRVVVLGVSAAIGVMLGLLVAFVPPLRRLVAFGDDRRATNAATAWDIVTRDPMTLLFGAGNHAVWPWYGRDAGVVPPPPADPLRPGQLLESPHSLFLQVFVELGVFGVVLLIVFFCAILWAAWLARRTPVALALLSAAAVCCVAFAFDHYLFKNFGVSWVWWCLLFAGLRLSSRDVGATSDAA